MRKMQRTNYVYNTVLKNSKRRDYLSIRIIEEIILFYKTGFCSLINRKPKQCDLPSGTNQLHNFSQVATKN